MPELRYIGRHIEDIRGSELAFRDDPNRITVAYLQDHRSVFRMLNAKDRDILFLSFVAGKKQKQIQRILGRSQPSLSYDIARIKHRMRFLHYLQNVSDIFMQFVTEAPQQGFDDETMEVLIMMFFTTSYTQASELMGRHQVSIRYHLNRAIERLAKIERWDVYEIFDNIRKNLNIVRRSFHRNNSKHGEKIWDTFLPA